MEDLYAVFLPRFSASARERIARALATATKRDYDASVALISDLHALTGEAGLLGLTTVVPLARDSEDKARRMRVSRTETDAEALIASLARLEDAVGAIR